MVRTGLRRYQYTMYKSKKLSKELKEELDKNYITVQELADITGRSSRGIQYHIVGGSLPALKVDNRCGKFRYMIAKEDAVGYLEELDIDVPESLWDFIPQKPTMESSPLMGSYSFTPSRECSRVEYSQRVGGETFIDRAKKYLLTVSLALAGKI